MDTPIPEGDAANASLKRKRSHSPDPSALQTSAAAVKAPKSSSNHLTINFLARQYEQDLPLVSTDDNLPAILKVLNDYQGVLERHESLACNLGARPLGPILIKRFERLFDGPPKVLKNHGKEGTPITWLDVVEFARNKPEQFTLGQMSEGVRVCQFYTKQCRVQVSEEDFVLIDSGIPQKLIPPQPIVEDEEKELGTLEILEKSLHSVWNLADQVAAKARQLTYRMRSRKQAILDRRASGGDVSYTATNPTAATLTVNGSNSSSAAPSPVGFVAVNSKYAAESHADPSRSGASPSTHNDLLSKFHTMSEKRAQSTGPVEEAHRSQPSSHMIPSLSAPGFPPKRPSPHPDFSATESFAPSNAAAQAATLNALGIPTPGSIFTSIQQTQHQSSPAPPSTFTAPPRDDGPFKAQMVAKMEQLKKGDRIIPPCDRCRRLHMDCLKNLTACIGCTKKHAKCSWKDVQEAELHAHMLSVAEANEAERDNVEAHGASATMHGNLSNNHREHSVLPGWSPAHETKHSLPPSLGYNHQPSTPGATNGHHSTPSSDHHPHSATLFNSPLNPTNLPQQTSSDSHPTQPLDPASAASFAAAAQALSNSNNNNTTDPELQHEAVGEQPASSSGGGAENRAREAHAYALQQYQEQQRRAGANSEESGKTIGAVGV